MLIVEAPMLSPTARASRIAVTLHPEAKVLVEVSDPLPHRPLLGLPLL